MDFNHKSIEPIEDLLSLAGKFGLNDECNPLRNFNDAIRLHPTTSRGSVEVSQGKSDWNKMTTDSLYNRGEETTEISIVSWNILSCTWYDESHSQPGLSWENVRFPKLQEWLTSFSTTSIICLQEVDFVTFENDLLPFMRTLGFEGIIQQWAKGPQNQPCAVAVFWKESLLQMVENKTSSRTLGARFKLNDMFSADRALFEFCVVNCHLESSQTAAGADKRARQLNSALSWASSKKLPILLCGDFNTGADSYLNHVLRVHKWHGHDLAAAYEHPSAANTIPASRATFAIPLCHFRIDHIFYSHRNFELVRLLNPLSTEEEADFLGVGKLKGFPTDMVPSDHLPIGAAFCVMKTTEEIESNMTNSIRLNLEIDQIAKERKVVLTSEWNEWQSRIPPKVNGMPTDDQIQERKLFKQNMKSWSNALSTTEQQFVKALRKR